MEVITYLFPMETSTNRAKEVSPKQQELTDLKDKSEMGDGLTGEEYLRMQMLSGMIANQTKKRVSKNIN